MKIKYDPDADAMYIRLTNNKFSYNKKVDETTIIDFDGKGQVIGIEILFLKERGMLKGKFKNILEFSDSIQKEVVYTI